MTCFLDAIASSSCYPCEWVSQSVSEWVIISDLPSISAIVGYLTLPTCLLTYSQLSGPSQSTGPFPVNWYLPSQLIPPSQSSQPASPLDWVQSSQFISQSSMYLLTYLLTCSSCSPNNTIITIICQFYCFSIASTELCELVLFGTSDEKVFKWRKRWIVNSETVCCC